MAPIKLNYRDRYGLWADLIRGNSDRLFIASDTRPAIGSGVPLEIHIDELSLPILARVTVVGWRAESARFQRGVFVRVADDELEKCRRFLGLRRSEPQEPLGRSVLRVHIEASVTIDGGEVALVRNISEAGLLIQTATAPSAGTRVSLTFALSPTEPPLEAEAIVAWSYPERSLAAFRFVDLSEEQQATLHRHIDAIARERAEQRASTRPILVADDDPAILKFLAAALARHGAEVYQATSGEETLRLARELYPALVVMDILMPGVDGAEVCKSMRADADLADVPVIFVSALGEPTLHQVADDSGASDYLLKPVALTDLINVVGRYLPR